MAKEEKTKEVTYNAEQMADMKRMLEQMLRNNNNGAISLYDQRDPQKITHVFMRRLRGKFVLGFKDLQNDPFKTTPLYVDYKFDPIRKLDRQPYITLILGDGEKEEEKELLLVDYYNEREYFQVPVKEVKVEKIIHDHGVLGNSGLAVAYGDNDKPLTKTTVKAESMTEKRTFIVEIPGFESTVEILEDFLA